MMTVRQNYLQTFSQVWWACSDESLRCIQGIWRPMIQGTEVSWTDYDTRGTILDQYVNGRTRFYQLTAQRYTNEPSNLGVDVRGQRTTPIYKALGERTAGCLPPVKIDLVTLRRPVEIKKEDVLTEVIAQSEPVIVSVTTQVVISH